MNTPGAEAGPSGKPNPTEFDVTVAPGTPTTNAPVAPAITPSSATNPFADHNPFDALLTETEEEVVFAPDSFTTEATPVSDEDEASVELNATQEEGQQLSEVAKLQLRLKAMEARLAATSRMSAIPSDAYTPPKPKHGHLVKLGADWIIICGGKPSDDFESLADATLDEADILATDRQRTLNAKAAASSYDRRIQGLQQKISDKMDIPDLLDKLKKVSERFGYDTITWVLDPRTGQPTNIFESYQRFGTLDELKACCVLPASKYDALDKRNDRDFSEFLRNSLSNKLLRHIRHVCYLDKDETFPVLFYRVMGELHSFSRLQLRLHKDKLKKFTPSKYSGQDLSQMGDEILEIVEALYNAGQYDHADTEDLLYAYQKAGGEPSSNNLGYNRLQNALRFFEFALREALPQVLHLSKPEQHSYMEVRGLTPHHLVRLVTSTYRELKDANLWEPAIPSKDHHTPRHLQANVVTLQESKGRCYNCGEEGHIARNCPKKGGQSHGKPSQSNKKRNQNQGRGRSRSSGGPGRGQGASASAQPSSGPSPWQPGQPTRRMVNGTRYVWSAEGRRWQRDDATTQPTSKPQANVGYSIELHPEDWTPPAVFLASVDNVYAVHHDRIVNAGRPIRQLNDHVTKQQPLIKPVSRPLVFSVLSCLFLAMHVFQYLWTHHSLALNSALLAVAHYASDIGSAAHVCGSELWSLLCAILKPVVHVGALFVEHWLKTGAGLLWLVLHGLAWYAAHLHHTTSYLEPVPSTPPKPSSRRSKRDLKKATRRMTATQELAASASGALRFNFSRKYPHRLRKENAHWLDMRHCAPTVARRVEPHPFPPPSAKPCAVSPQSRRPSSARLPKTAHMNSRRPQPHGFAALASPSGQASGKETQFSVIWDSGASLSVSPCKDDFVGPIRPVPSDAILTGLFADQGIDGIGTVIWTFEDTTGMLRSLRVPAYYMPKAGARLLSTPSLLQCYPSEFLQQDPTTGFTLSGSLDQPEDGSQPTKPIQAPLNPSTNLPTAIAYAYECSPATTSALLANTTALGDGPPVPPQEPLDETTALNPSPSITAIHQRNGNLTETEKELLRWHFRLGHVHFRRLQFLLRSGALSSTDSARRLQTACAKLRRFPMCAACQFAKQRARSTPGQTVHAVRDAVDSLRRDQLFAGQRVSVDHFHAATKGRSVKSRGKSPPDSSKYVGGSIFCDHATGFIHIEFQYHLTAADTLQAKEKYELLCRDYGVVPQQYLLDHGGAFTSQDFARHLVQFEQQTRFAGTSAHHQNGIAERAIQTVMSTARAMIIHAAIHWPSVVDSELWPLAVKHAVYLWNHLPNPSTGISPHDLFSRTRWPHGRFKEAHVWGCPVYLLDKRIADGMKLPRWSPRSARCVYVGQSESHSSSVALVLNLETGTITPQFHLVFDDYFTTVAMDPDELPDFFSPQWYQLFGDSAYQYVPSEEDDDDTPDDADAPSAAAVRRDVTVRAAFDREYPPIPLEAPLPPTAVTHPPTSLPAWEQSHPRESPVHPASAPRDTLTASPASALPREQSLSREPSLPEESLSAPESAHEIPVRNLRERNDAAEAAPILRRSLRFQRPIATELGQPSALFAQYDIAAAHKLAHSAHFAPLFMLHSIPAPTIYKAAASDPDTLTFDQAMKDILHVNEWRAAAAKEIAALESQGTWVEVPVSDATSRILPCTWIFRRKRHLADGTIKKFKARCCVRGDLQETQLETFAPVIAWSTTRLLLTFALVLDWSTSSIDFASAFVQAKLNEPVWIHLPRGFKSSKGPNTCLQLKKSLYGLSVAPRLWYEHLSDALKAIGLKQSAFDKCLFFGDGILVGFHVDDALIVARSSTIIDYFIDKLQKRGFELTKEEDICDYLGIKLERSDGKIKMTQTSLIEKIISTTGLQNAKPNSVPATALALSSDPDGPAINENWSYTSVVGMLLYLSTNTRPDIAFAVSQVARFTSNPKQSHAIAVKIIVRYLLGTKTEGTTIEPSKSLSLDMYCDADFGGLYNREPHESKDAVRSRTGFIVLLAGCPLVWKSQLQSQIALSTLEAEYTALSQSLKTLIPLKRLMVEIVGVIGLPEGVKATISARVFEDNQSCYYLATNQHITSRTKYFLVKWHWFWDHSHQFTLYKVSSQEQLADYLTKGLPKDLFESIRFTVQGW
jgi:hypothetical protein